MSRLSERRPFTFSRFSSHLFSRLALMAVGLAGIALAVGSKSYDPDDDEPVDPVLVDFVVSANGDITLENGSTLDTVSTATLSGSFEKGGNDEITLRNVPVTLDIGTTFDLEVVPNDGENLLVGTLSAAVSQALEFGVERSPEAGQISLTRDDTTTLITFAADSDNVDVAVGSETPVTLSFADLRTLFSDTDRDLDLRFASKAYRTLENLWLVARISETAQEDIRNNLDMLESIGLASTLDLTCDSTDGTPTPSYRVAWTVDPAGTGNGTPGAGDSFELSWFNCLDNGDTRYLQNSARLSNYQLDNDSLPRNRSYSFVLSSTFFGEDAVDTLVPSLTQSRIDGTLQISATEGDTVTAN